MNKRYCGYTLLEVLIVIFIILVLAALTFPVFGGVKQRAHETTCISNIRQIYAAAQLYRADFDANPPNSLLFPAWRPYLPEQIAMGCIAAAGNPDRFLAGDYFAYFDIDSLNPRSRACAIRREGDWPVIIDKHHLGVRVARAAGRRVLILGRENGSVVTILGQRIEEYARSNRQNTPCPELEDPYANQ